MGEERASSLLTLEVKGPHSSSTSDPPAGVPATLVASEIQKGLDAQAWVNLILEVNWPVLISGVGINIFSQWLYERFRPSRGNAAMRDSMNTIKITVKGKNITVSVTDPSVVERALREVVDAAERDRSTEQD